MPSCPRCNKAVYDAESQGGAGKLWHSSCFTCKSCNTRLSSTTLTEKSGELYCAPCYGKLFGPKGFGIGGVGTVTGVSVADSDSKSNGNRCGSCGAKNQTAKFCGECGKAVASTGNSDVNNAAYNKPPSPRASSRQINPVKTNVNAPSNYNQAGSTTLNISGTVNSKCGRCKQTVYFAEAVQGAGKQWHAECFVCTECKKGLNSQTLSEKEGVLYCNGCYAKVHGPKGYGFGGGAGTFHYTK